MNVQMERNQKVMNQVKIWYDQIYPMIEEQTDELTITYYISGKKMNQKQYQAYKEKANETYDIKINHLEQIIVTKGHELNACCLVLRNKQTGKMMKKQIKQWVNLNENSKVNEVWIFVY